MDTIKMAIVFTMLPKFRFLLKGDTQTGTVITAFLPVPSFPLHVISDLLIKQIVPGGSQGRGRRSGLRKKSRVTGTILYRAAREKQSPEVPRETQIPAILKSVYCPKWENYFFLI